MQKYTVQYHNGKEMIEDTKPISYEEAVDIFKGHIEDFKRNLNNNPELTLWDISREGKDYDKAVFCLDNKYRLRNNVLYRAFELVFNEKEMTHIKRSI